MAHGKRRIRRVITRKQNRRWPRDSAVNLALQIAMLAVAILEAVRH